MQPLQNQPLQNLQPQVGILQTDDISSGEEFLTALYNVGVLIAMEGRKGAAPLTGTIAIGGPHSRMVGGVGEELMKELVVALYTGGSGIAIGERGLGKLHLQDSSTHLQVGGPREVVFVAFWEGVFMK